MQRKRQGRLPWRNFMGPMCRSGAFANAKGVPIRGMRKSAGPGLLLLVPRNRGLREQRFMTATKIGRPRDIAVMAQFERNAGIRVTLPASA